MRRDNLLPPPFLFRPPPRPYRSKYVWGANVPPPPHSSEQKRKRTFKPRPCNRSENDISEWKKKSSMENLRSPPEFKGGGEKKNRRENFLRKKNISRIQGTRCRTSNKGYLLLWMNCLIVETLPCLPGKRGRGSITIPNLRIL